MNYNLLKIIPIGGLGEIGTNCLIYEYDDHAIMVDCGILFPENEPGINIIYPRFDYLTERPSKLKALILTHGHEDHIGAVPFLLRNFDVPVYASPFVHKLIEQKLDEFPYSVNFEKKVINDGSRISTGPFNIEFIGMNHSIPENMSLMIETPAGKVFHTSDFKIGSPDDADAIDVRRLEKIREKGVNLMLSDSTNIERDGQCEAESTVIETIAGIIEKSASRVFITFFPSNIRRFHSLLQLASRIDKKVVLLGRSMENYFHAAVKTGLIPDDNYPIIPPYQIARENESRLIMFASGTQGEPQSAMTKISRGEHSNIKIQKGDIFIYSSRHIPGNEKRISRVMDDIAKQGGIIYHTENTPGIHVSGHGHRKELEKMINLISPSSFIPIHGNYHFLTQHAQMAASTGIKDVLVIQNGDVVHFSPDSGLRISGQVQTGKVMMDGLMEISEKILNQRMDIARGGVISILISISNNKRNAPELKNISGHGIPDAKESFNPLEDISNGIKKILERANRFYRIPANRVRKRIKKAIESYFDKFSTSRPYVIVEFAADEKIQLSDEDVTDGEEEQ